jgi:hypothetical protein
MSIRPSSTSSFLDFFQTVTDILLILQKQSYGPWTYNFHGNNFLDIFWISFADIVMKFGVIVYNNELQINFEFRYYGSIFDRVISVYHSGIFFCPCPLVMELHIWYNCSLDERMMFLDLDPWSYL